VLLLTDAWIVVGDASVVVGFKFVRFIVASSLHFVVVLLMVGRIVWVNLGGRVSVRVMVWVFVVLLPAVSWAVQVIVSFWVWVCAL